MSIITVPTAPVLPMPPHTAWPPHPEKECDEKALQTRPCLAFLEFDEFGETWEKNSTGRPTQLNAVRDLIRQAKLKDPKGQPLILTFIHGWKHNSSEGGEYKSGADDSNVIGLASTLNELATVQYPGHVVIGIYISWRGGLISPFWPVAQQFTYWNREATAIRVGNTSLTEALIEISDVAHEAMDCGKEPCSANESCRQALAMTLSQQSSAPNQSCSPVLLFVGHSFGALVLERAISQAMVTRMEREYSEETARRRAEKEKAKADKEKAKENPACATSCANPVDETQPIAFVPLANLIIFVNSAAAATESKETMDYLASSKFTYGLQDSSQSGEDQPLFLSVTSEADSATGVFLKVGHAVPWLGYKFNGSLRNPSPQSGNGPTTSYARACFNPASGVSSIKFDLSQGDYYMTTTAHKQELWSHTVTAGTTKPTPGVQDPSCRRSSPGAGTYATCWIGQVDYEIKPMQQRCNGTPYWVLQVPKEIVPDHNTIFTDRLIAFLTPFIPQEAQEGEKGGEVLLPRMTKKP